MARGFFRSYRLGPRETLIKFEINNIKAILVIDDWGIFCELFSYYRYVYLHHIMVSLNPTDEKSTLLQVIVITWSNINPFQYLHTASLGHNELNEKYHWLCCTGCCQFLLNMKCMMYGLLFLQLSTSLGWTTCLLCDGPILGLGF